MSTSLGVRERRHSPRLAIQGELRYRRIPIVKGRRSALLQDLSEGGFRFRSEELLNNHSNLLVELHFPSSNPIRSLATVAWVKALPEDSGYEVGSTLVDTTREARAALEKILQGH